MFLVLTSTRFDTKIPKDLDAGVFSERSRCSAKQLRANSHILLVAFGKGTALLVAHPKGPGKF